jgi:hypothetical protein
MLKISGFLLKFQWNRNETTAGPRWRWNLAARPCNARPNAKIPNWYNTLRYKIRQGLAGRQERLPFIWVSEIQAG